MKLSEFKTLSRHAGTLTFALPNGRLVPEYFHITEMGLLTKSYIDCGGTVREEKKISFQIWFAQDYEHRLTLEKLDKIISAAEPLLGAEDLEIVVEYQTDLSISNFGLSYKEGVFHLTPIESHCQAADHCGIPADKMKVSLKDLGSANSCSPHSGCC